MKEPTIDLRFHSTLVLLVGFAARPPYQLFSNKRATLEILKIRYFLRLVNFFRFDRAIELMKLPSTAENLVRRDAFEMPLPSALSDWTGGLSRDEGANDGPYGLNRVVADPGFV